MNKRFTEEQIIGFLREADAGCRVRVVPQAPFSEASYCLRRSKFGEMDVAYVKRLKTFEIDQGVSIVETQSQAYHPFQSGNKGAEWTDPDFTDTNLGTLEYPSIRWPR